MKTAKEILQNKIGKNVVFSMDGDIIIGRDRLNANDIVSAMEEYRKEGRFYTEDEIRIIQEQHYHAGYQAGQQSIDSIHIDNRNQ